MEISDFKKAFPKLAHHLGDRNTELIATLMKEKEVPAGSVLIADRALADALFLVIDGEFRVEVGQSDKAFEIGRIGHGKWIGEVPLLCGDNASTSRIVAIVPSRVLELRHADFWSARTDNPDLVSALTREFVEQMSQRARAADELIAQCMHRECYVHASPPSQA
jgi:CRP-like cAMP-binding protein